MSTNNPIREQPKIIIAQVIEVLQTIFDPEIPSVSVWDLGLIYGIMPICSEVKIIMSFTSINCPVADSLPVLIQTKVLTQIPHLTHCEVEVVWEPMWDKSLISEEGRLILGL